MLLVLVLTISIIASFSLAGCKEEAVEEEAAAEEEEEAVEEAAEPYSLAVLLPGTVEFFNIERKGIDAAAEDFGVEITYADAEWDAGNQLSQVENYVASGVDAILLCAADNEALTAAVPICNDAGIPLITFTNTVGPNPDGTYEGIVTFIGTNEISVGKLLGEMAEQLLGDEDGKIVMIEGNPGTAPQRFRRQGFEDVMAEHDNWEIVYSQSIEGWTKEGALAMMEDFIQTGQDFNFVSAQWSTGAVAAAQAMEEAGIIDQAYVTGVEISKECVPYVKSGDVDMLSNYSVEQTGYITIENTVKYLNGETIPEFIEVLHEIVTVENVDTTNIEM
ncbi:MAG: sugar ABC transporter substrate-binding protein [Actinomycetota bacterium]|nr:sugar ABC transporter substrate-binding protein [Actinomycetota bacterium]